MTSIRGECLSAGSGRYFHPIHLQWSSLLSLQSLIKLNGHPYYELVRPAGWLWYASSTENPLLLLLNLLLTNISYLYPASDWFGRDLSLERFTILLFGKAVQENGVSGWLYEPVNLSKRDLESDPSLPEEDWRPMSVTSFQFTVLTMMGDEDGLSREVMKAIAADDPSVDGEAQIKELVDHRLVGLQGDKLVFLTQRCATAFTGWGEVVAGDGELTNRCACLFGPARVCFALCAIGYST